MPTKPYILTAFDHAFESKRFFWSLTHVLGDSVIPLCIMYAPHGEVELPETASLIKEPRTYPGNTGRFIDLFTYLPQLHLDENAWFIFTDVHDVIFQDKLPELDALDADILVCSEGKKFEDSEFWSTRFPKDVLPWQMYNVGSFAMRYKPLMEFLESLHTTWAYFADWYNSVGKGEEYQMNFPFDMPYTIERTRDVYAATFNSYADTLIFNRFLRRAIERYRIAELSGLFSTYAFNLELGNIVEKDEKTYTKDGKLISILHFNGDTKRYFKQDPLPEPTKKITRKSRRKHGKK